jgi:hypothetical protein
MVIGNNAENGNTALLQTVESCFGQLGKNHNYTTLSLLK